MNDEVIVQDWGIQFGANREAIVRDFTKGVGNSLRELPRVTGSLWLIDLKFCVNDEVMVHNLTEGKDDSKIQHHTQTKGS